jgi:putative cardiolipin synthase
MDLSLQFDTYWNSDWSFPLEMFTEGEDSRRLEEYRAWLQEYTKRELSEDTATRAESWLQAAEQAIEGEMQVFYDTPAANDPAADEELPIQLAREILHLIETAKEELILVSAYLIPTPEFEKAIEQAEDRGVRVRLLTNSLRSNNHVAAHSAYRHHVRRLVIHGAEVHEVRAYAKDRALYMELPLAEKQLGLHAKLLLVDDNRSFIGSANFDPRSLQLNTEMGILITGERFNREVREALEIDFDRRNSWYLQFQESGELVWVGDDTILDEQPAESYLQRIEDWFLSILPIEAEM